MNSEVELLAAHNAKCEQNEAHYVEMRTVVQRRLQRSMEIRAALDSLDLKLQRAALEFDQQLQIIEQNFKAQADG